jgi:large subunit ribosomal protein L30
MDKKLKVTWIRSTIRRPKKQKLTITALGFHRLNETRLLPDNPAMRGMVHQVRHLVTCEVVDGGTA